MKKIILLILILIAGSLRLHAQAGMDFGELARKLDPYFDIALINDIKQQLPQGSDYKIWGWDVGDFSGDGRFDVAFTVRVATGEKRTMQVYMFVDISGYLIKVGQFPYKYVEVPLEIGVMIKYNGCFITKKNEKYNWLIRGYRFDRGSLIMLDEYTTRRIGRYTYQAYRNFQNLQNIEKYFVTLSGKEKFYLDFLTIPSYPRGQKIYQGYYANAFSNNIDYVYKGAYDWKGDHDASFLVSSAYDDQNLYMTIDVTDDKIVHQLCDTCIADHIELWLDVTPPPADGNRLVKTDGKLIDYRKSADTGIYRFTIYPGDFLEKKAFIQLISTDDFKTVQKISAHGIKAISNITEKGYIVKIKIPFPVLGYQMPPLYKDKPTEFGCTVVVHDFDNKFREYEKTEIATSQFSSINPSTYGSLLLFPDNQRYGHADNIFKDEILKHLIEYGF